jgi:DNA invertase Pin-like site-specific DNA recombinase
MTNALTVRRIALPTSEKRQRAAQYVRMSTELQRYSIQNQAAAIAVFAQQHGLTIIRTYIDEGKSGLRIKGRAGLTELVDDVSSGRADFDHILVYDVSRWGRFQDVDESAHYEFICKQKGIKVVYCAEQFENDGSLLSSIVKNLKRVMAAEYSRELSVKVHTGQCRIAGLGFRVGGPLNFGLRRELIDEHQQSKGWLTKGERKALQTDRVRLRLGSKQEAAIVRSIFHQFVAEKKSVSAIRRLLNQKRIVSHHGRSWTNIMIHTVLQNEAYVGNLVHNRTSRRLGEKEVKNPAEKWVRREGVIDPIVDARIFARAQKMLAELYVAVPEDEMLRRLRLLLHRKGELSEHIINEARGVPCVSTFAVHFGSLRNAYARIGYVPKYHCAWFDERERWDAVRSEHASSIVDAFQHKAAGHVKVHQTGAIVAIDHTNAVTVLVARHQSKSVARPAPEWRAYYKRRTTGLFVVLRLNEANQDIADFVVVPASAMKAAYLFLGVSLPRGAVLIRQWPEVIRKLVAQLRITT